MNSEWIKMQCNLWDDPKVVGLFLKLGVPVATVIGCLFRLWSIGYSTTPDGILVGYTLAALDERCGVPGFAGALKDAKWLKESEDGISIPQFDKNIGDKAKHRQQAADRQKLHRQRKKLGDADAEDTESDLALKIARELCNFPSQGKPRTIRFGGKTIQFKGIPTAGALGLYDGDDLVVPRGRIREVNLG